MHNSIFLTKKMRFDEKNHRSASWKNQLEWIRLLLDVVVVVAEIAAHAVAADGLPVAEFDVAIVEFEIDAAVVRDGVLIRAFGGAAAGQAGADAVEIALRRQTGAGFPVCIRVAKEAT